MKEKERILLKLRNMKKYVDFLKSQRKVNEEKLKKDYLLKSAIERNFHIALESVFDIGEMIISIKEFRKPEDYKEVIEILGEEGILPKEFAERFAPAAGFRNILVHRYAEVKLSQLYRHLQEDLEDFDFFAKCIAEFAKKLDNPYPLGCSFYKKL
ncbi:MAG: hypothetical protein AOA65_1698 [Candidatus Bathyarchaeota archaeon BA1]|nr:MAG: hypothetical protein AOA65_1698 [Candidatus Bathyarchaeota archaeon BA1]